MITKLQRLKNSWIIKFLLILTALSFVSLFGITGYINSASDNRAVVKVDDIVISRAEITQKYNQEMQMAKSLFGDNLDISEAMRNSILQNIVQKELVNAIMAKTADDLGVSISDEYIRQVIFSQAEFLDADGRFNLNKFRRLLSTAGWSEKKYIESLKSDIIKQHLIQTPLENMNVPTVMSDYLEKINNQKKVFKYIKIEPEKLKADRKISQEELEQYYQDFSLQFTAPEERDVSFVLISNDDIASKIKPSQEEIEAYYEQNIGQFVTPETRNVLQMVFDTKEAADAAMAKLSAGQDFYAVAAGDAKQSKADTELGYVAKDMLIADMSDAVFDLQNGKIAGPVKSEMGWHIMKVTGIKPKVVTTVNQAKNTIIAAIQKEKAYDNAYEVSRRIEDEIGSGKALEDIASENGTTIYKVKGLNDEGKARAIPEKFKKLLASDDFIDTAFSYNVDEISQVIEEDDGFVVVRVDNIVDAHVKDIEDVKSEIVKMWEANEKEAIAQEIVNDVNHDLENGDKIEEVAKRFNLNLQSTKPLKRSETFAGLSPMQVKELFYEDVNVPHIVNIEDGQLIVVNSGIINSKQKIGKDELDVLKAKVKADMTQDAANQMVNAFGTDHKIKVDYKNAGLEDL